MLCGYGISLLVGEEIVDMKDLRLWEKMSSCGRGSLLVEDDLILSYLVVFCLNIS